MSFIQNFFTSRDNNTDGNTYVGQEGRLWYNPDTNSIYVNTANIAGGTPVALATGANITANNLTVNTITSTGGNVSVTGNLVISGNISPASNVKIGGIKAGAGVDIANDGTLTIDTANLPLSFGDFTANNNILTIVNVNEDMILATQGNAEIQLVGNVGFYRTNGLPPDPANLFAFFNNDGQASFYIPDTDPLGGAFKIIGSATGDYTPPLNTGVMLQITGQANDASRIYNDSVGSFAAFVGRRINGNVASPTAVQAGQEIIRISSTGYDGNSIPGGGTARIVFQAMENYTTTAKGSNLSLWATANGTTTLTQVANVTVENGFSATKFNTSGIISATGNVTGGNIITGGVITATGNVTTGNVITAGMVTATANISGGNILTGGLITATGNVTAGNVNSYVTLPAGTTTKAPLTFASGPILTTAAPGAVDYDGVIFYATPQAQERGLIKASQTYVLNTDYALLNQTAVQTLFGVSAAVSSNTRYVYNINAVIYKTANNITMSFALDGGAGLARHTYQTTTTATSTLATLGTASVLKNIITTGFATPVIVTAALNGTGFYSLQVTGVVNVTTGGTWNPLVAFSGLPGVGSYVAAGSYVEIYPVGPGNATVSVGNWT